MCSLSGLWGILHFFSMLKFIPIMVQASCVIGWKVKSRHGTMWKLAVWPRQKRRTIDTNNLPEGFFQFWLIWPQLSSHFWLYFERKSMKLNLIRKSMKLSFSELGKQMSKILSIILAFTALWEMNSKKMTKFWKSRLI